MENLKEYFQGDKNRVVMIISGVVMVALIIVAITYLNPDKVLIRKSEDAVREQLKYNPDEATFSKQEVYEDSDGTNVSGYVLASNGYNAKRNVKYIVAFDEHGEAEDTYIYDDEEDE